MTVKVEVLPIGDGAQPDQNNVNKHTQKGGGFLENSLRKRGAFRSIASAGKGVDIPVVMAGNFTLEKAIDAGFTEIVNVHVTGGQIVNVVRDDLDPSSPEAIALGIEDNEIGKQSYNPDIDILAAVMADPAMQTLRDEDKILAGLVEGMKPYQVDYQAEWQGMPEFDNPPKAYKSIMVHFENEESYREFCKLIKQELTEKTNSCWYPQKERRNMKELEFENQS